MKIYSIRKIAFRNKIDILSQNIARSVFTEIIKDPTPNRIINIYSSVTGNPTTDIDLNICSINRISFEISYPNETNLESKIKLRGAFYTKSRFPNIVIEISPRKFSNKNYEELFQELKYNIRHELEHAVNTRNNEKPNKNNTLSYNNKVEEYLLKPTEIEAYTRDSMLRAKNSKIPIEEVVKNMISEKMAELMKLENITDRNILNSSYNKILKIYLERIKQIYGRRNEQ